MRKRSKILIDWDGTTAKGAGINLSPNPPPEDLKEILGSVSKHYYVCIITGQPLSVARQMPPLLGLPVDISPDHGSYIITPDGEEYCTIPELDLSHFRDLTPKIDHMIDKWGAKKDPRETRACINCFFDNEENFEYALEIWNQEKNGLTDLKTTWNRTDWSANFLPQSAGKINAILHYKEMCQNPLLIGAGDSSSDADILRHAQFPIACYDTSLGSTHPLLKQIIQERGVGHIATKPDGYGLMEGLLKAKELGIIDF